jgi:phosphatidylinositol 3-kinase
MLRLGGSCEDLAHFITPSPINPSIRLSGVIPDACLVFKSKVNPVKLVWNVDGRYESETPYAFIYKKGDDLRQDQLVLQIFSLMDRYDCAHIASPLQCFVFIVICP